METQQQELIPTTAPDARALRPGKIVEALLAIAAEVPFVGKTDENEQQHYKFRSIDAVMAALKPLLVKHKVLVYPVNILAEEAGKGPKDNGFRIRQRIVYRFEHLDGSCRDVVVTGEGVDYGDKSCNKAMTVSLKYVCGQVFFIPYCEWADSDNESPENGPPAQRSSQPASQGAKPAQRGAPKPPGSQLPKVADLLAVLKVAGIEGKVSVLGWIVKQLKHPVEATKELSETEILVLHGIAKQLPPKGKE